MNPLGLDPRRLLVAACAARGDLLGLGQIVPLAPGLWEVRSVVVAPTHRGRGVGGALVRRLCEAAAAGEAVVLTTIARRRAFYERAGFEEAPFSEAPRWGRALRAAGVGWGSVLQGGP